MEVSPFCSQQSIWARFDFKPFKMSWQIFVMGFRIAFLTLSLSCRSDIGLCQKATVELLESKIWGRTVISPLSSHIWFWSRSKREKCALLFSFSLLESSADDDRLSTVEINLNIIPWLTTKGALIYCLLIRILAVRYSEIDYRFLSRHIISRRHETLSLWERYRRRKMIDKFLWVLNLNVDEQQIEL